MGIGKILESVAADLLPNPSAAIANVKAVLLRITQIENQLNSGNHSRW